MTEELLKYQSSEEELHARLAEANEETLRLRVEEQSDSLSQGRIIREERLKDAQQMKEELLKHQSTEQELLDSLSQERIIGEERLQDAQQMKEELLKHQTTEEELHAKLGEANEEIENLKRQVEEQSDSLSQERIIGEERLQDAQQMKEELLKHQTTEEELHAKLAEANEEIGNLRRQVEEQSDSLSQERINGEGRLQDAQQITEELLKHQSTEKVLYARLAEANEETLRLRVEEQSDSLSQGRIIREERLKDAQQMKEELLKHQSTEQELLAKLGEANEEIENLKRQVEEQSDSLSQERIIGEERLQDAQQMKEELLKHQTTEEELHAKLGEANEEIENLKRQVEEQSDSLSQERIIGEERLQDAQQMKEELLKHQTTEEELHAKLAEANEEIGNLRRQVEEQSDSLSQERINGEGRLQDAQQITEELLKHQSTEKVLYARLAEANEETLRLRVEEQSDSLSQGRIIREERLKDAQQMKEELLKHQSTEQELLDSLSQERIIGEERLQDAQQMKEELLKHQTTEEELHAKLGEANEEIENLKRQVEEQSDSLSQERIIGEERLQDAQQMKEELLKHQTTEEELHAKLAEANEEIGNLRRQVEEQSGMRYHVPNQETDRLPHDNAMSSWTQETNNLQDREDLESTSYERKIRDLKNELHSQQERVNDNEAQIEQLNKTINDKSDENCRLLQRILKLETAEKQLNEIKTKASEEESLREAEIEKLQKELDSMNESLNQERNIGEVRLKEIEKLEEDIHNHRTREEDYQQKLEEANREMENLKRQTEKQCADNGSILHKYLEEEKTSKHYKVSLEVMGQEKEEVESQLHYTKEKLAQTEREVIITKEEHKAEKSKLEEAFQRLKAQSSQEIEKQHQQINKLKDDIQRLETILAHTTNELEGKKVENKKLESELNRIKRELEGIKNEKTQLEDHICQLNGEINTRDTRIMKMNGDLTMKEAEKTYANECMQKAVQRQQEMTYQLSTLQRVEMEKNQAEQDKKSLLDENNLLRASLKETDDFRSYLQNYYKILQDTQLALQRETDKNRHFNELLSSNGHRMENMTADLRNYRSLAESHRKSLEEKKDYVHGLQRNIDKLTYENEKLKEERDKYHQESFELKDRCQGLTEELEQSRNESRELREQAEAADGTSENRSFPNQGQ
ncbi:trichohyalin-like isoform X5 [Saccostrea cucullata]|uniref:trichohyalin-like isoform X5 n=1 Tax=Saccostrea cuccullata TaxID=36930 RepID=UPI002ED19F8B